MAAGPTTQVSDIIVPQLFTPYIQQYTTVKSALIASGAVVPNEFLNNFLDGGGLTVHMPSFRDLDDDPENISTDDPDDFFKRPFPNPGTNSTPYKIRTSQEIAVRLSRNQSWGSSDLTAALMGADPLDAVQNLVGNYWIRREQDLFISVMKGIFANNATATDAYHVQNDMTVSIAGSAFADGVTNFGASTFIDATLTMGDAMDSLALVMMHSVVYARAQKNNLIDFIPDSQGQINIPTFLGRRVIIDDRMPAAGGVYETWLFGQGAVQRGQGLPKVPTETHRYPNAGNGGGMEVLHSRLEWAMHPVGHAYVGTPPVGGPSNAATTGTLAAATSWQRAFSERKQIKIARLVTREA